MNAAPAWLIVDVRFAATRWRKSFGRELHVKSHLLKT
jgi:hypothetical protein